MHKDNKNHYNKTYFRFFLLFFFKKVDFQGKTREMPRHNSHKNHLLNKRKATATIHTRRYKGQKPTTHAHKQKNQVKPEQPSSQTGILVFFIYKFNSKGQKQRRAEIFKNQTSTFQHINLHIRAQHFRNKHKHIPRSCLKLHRQVFIEQE